MTLAYILGVFSIFILVAGLVVLMVMLFKKISKLLSCLVFSAFIVVAVIIGIICAIIFTISIDSENSEITKEYFDKIDYKNEEVKKEIDKKKEEENKISEESGSTPEKAKTPRPKDQGKIKNTDYNFIITVGKEEVKKIRMVKTKPFEGVTDSYAYCYQTNRGNYDGSSSCKENEAPVFSINIYTKKQWEKESKSPFAGTVMGQDGGYYFVFYHPNGILPDEVPATEKYYNSVIQSIDFAD